ncbi:hypothetical protein SAMN05216357_11263 [Porphyromonadaceae bacterium KH3CP3RA]|nr:hypothetical protein SAMN05216357_11263 [Porphyromonadaceae bacterium KH3CP3RA]
MMTFNLLLTGRESVMIGISIVCAFLIAAMMIPKAIRHRKQLREQGDKDTTIIIGDSDESSNESSNESIGNDNHSSH